MSMSLPPAQAESPRAGLDHSSSAEITTTELAQRGIDYCRAGQWRNGLSCLQAAIHGASSGSIHLPGGYYGFLGAALVKVEKRYKDGLEFCNVGLKKEFYLPDNYLNLARVYLAVGEEGKAYASARRGLVLDEDHAATRKFLSTEFPPRKRPVLKFLKRSSPVNVLLGKVRQACSPDEN